MKNDIGDFLKTTRLEKNYDLNFVASILKIRKAYIKSIENMDIASLPDRVFILGYVKNYAKFLELDQINVVKKYSALIEKCDTSKEYDVGTCNSSPTKASFLVSILMVIVFYNYFVFHSA